MARNREMPPLPSAEENQMPPLPGVEEAIDDAPAKTSKGIEVIALRPGFYDCQRRKEGDRFIVPSMKQLGSWMKCVDSKIERDHQSALRAKKQKANAAVD